MRPKAAYSVVPTPSPRSARSLMKCVTESEDDCDAVFPSILDALELLLKEEGI
jgi:hypothetical protein